MKESVAICTAVGIDIRSMDPAQVVMLAGDIFCDKILHDRAYAYRVPASQGARDRVAAVMAMPEEERFAMTDAESAQFTQDIRELVEPADYNKALASFSKEELAALRPRIAAR